VWRQLPNLLLLVQLDLLGGVDREDLVRVDRDQDRTGVRLKRVNSELILVLFYVVLARVIKK
jgi:hypothetical protein